MDHKEVHIVQTAPAGDHKTKEEHHVRREGPLGTEKEDIKIKTKGCGLDQTKDVKIKQDGPCGTRKIEEHVSVGDKDEGLLSKAARKVGLKD